MADIEKYEGRVTSGEAGRGRERLGCVELSSSVRVFTGWDLVSGVTEVGLGVVMGGISRVVFVMWILGVVV